LEAIIIIISNDGMEFYFADLSFLRPVETQINKNKRRTQNLITCEDETTDADEDFVWTSLVTIEVKLDCEEAERCCSWLVKKLPEEVTVCLCCWALMAFCGSQKSILVFHLFWVRDKQCFWLWKQSTRRKVALFTH